MALANTACLLADQQSRGNGILMIDWDLEAPGLHRYFEGQFTQAFSKLPDRQSAFDKHPGLIDLFLQLDQLVPQEPSRDEDNGFAAPAILDKVNLQDYIIKTDIAYISLLKAGCFDARYSSRVNTFDWEALYKRCPGLILEFAERLSHLYRFVLIDSRTGLTDISGICTMLMPEQLVVVFTPNRQSLTGVLDLVRRATTYRRQSDDLRPLLVFPLPSRIETSEPARRMEWRYGNLKKGIEGYQPVFESLFKEVYDLKDFTLGPYFDEIQIQHVAPYAYGEEIAALIERGGDSLSLTRSYRNFAERLVHSDGPWASVPQPDAMQLAEAQALAKRTESFALETARQASRWSMIAKLAGTAIVLLLAASLYVYMTEQQKWTKEQQKWTARQNEFARSARLAAKAGLMIEKDPELAVLLSLEANRQEKTTVTLTALLATLEKLSGKKAGAILSGDPRGTYSIDYSPDGETLASGGVSGEATILDVKTGKLRTSFARQSKSAVGSVAFSPDGKHLAVGSFDGTISLWDIATVKTTWEQPGAHHSRLLEVIAFSRDGQMLASVSDNTSILLWKIVNGIPVKKPLRIRHDNAWSIAFKPDSKVLASGSHRDGSVALWDAATGLPLRDPLKGTQQSIQEVIFSPDGRLLALVADDKTILLWDVISGLPKGRPFRGHRGEIYCAAFSPDGQTIASGSADGTVLLWDVDSGRAMSEPLSGRQTAINDVDFSPDGKLLALSGSGDAIILWNIEIGNWESFACRGLST